MWTAACLEAELGEEPLVLSGLVARLELLLDLSACLELAGLHVPKREKRERKGKRGLAVCLGISKASETNIRKKERERENVQRWRGKSW